MTNRGEVPTLRDLNEFIAKVMRDPQIALPLRMEAAGLLVGNGWADLLGVLDDIRQILGADQAEVSRIDQLYVDDSDAMFDDRG